DPGGHRVDQAPVTAVGRVTEIVAAVLELGPHPAQRLLRGQAGRIRLDVGRQQLTGPRRRARGPAPGGAAGAPSRPAKAPISDNGFALAHGTPASRANARIGFPSGVWIHDPPSSTGEPPRSGVCRRPPIRSLASSTTQSTPAWVRALATVSPAIPAPTTTT